MKKSGSGVLEGLKQASQGLLFPSETDAPFEPFEWEGQAGKPDKTRMLELAGLSPGTPVKTKALDAFFQDVTEEQDWHDDQEKAEVQRFKQLVQAIKEALSDVRVFEAGRTEKDMYIGG
jgi:hypothetical protein